MYCLFFCRLVKLEKSEFDCSLCKGGMEVQHVVSAVVVVLISAVICTIRRIPDVCKLCHVGGLFPVQLFDELGIDQIGQSDWKDWLFRSGSGFSHFLCKGCGTGL